MRYITFIFVFLTLVLAITGLSQPEHPVNWPLNQAVIADNISRLKALLSTNPSQKALDYALAAAAGKGRDEAARLLLKAHASPNFKIQPAGYTSVIIATREGHSETLAILLKNGGDPNIMDNMGWRPLHHSVTPQYEHVEAIRTLVKHGAMIDGRDSLKRTVLHRAAGFGHISAVRLLLELGADPTLLDKYGNTASQRAERAGYHAIAKLIQDSR